MVERNKKRATLKISHKLQAEIANRGSFGETYEDILWKLIKEDKKKWKLKSTNH